MMGLGMILPFDDPSTRLPAIDSLEVFRPGGPSLYKRVFVASSRQGGHRLGMTLYWI
jgi:hypothetical protein